MEEEIAYDESESMKMYNDEKNLKALSMKRPETKLNSLSLARAIRGSAGDVFETNKDSSSASHITTKTQKDILKALNSPAKMYAGLMHLSITAGSIEARSALLNDKFGMLSANDIAKASQDVAKIMPKGQVSVVDAKALVKGILSNLAYAI